MSVLVAIYKSRRVGPSRVAGGRPLPFQVYSTAARNAAAAALASTGKIERWQAWVMVVAVGECASSLVRQGECMTVTALEAPADRQS